MKTSHKILIGVALALIVIQFFGIDKSAVASDPSKDLIAIEETPAEVQDILKQACYDCHSYKTEYPWYTNVAPLSWWIGHHIDEGRHHLNFSVWGEYSDKRREHKMEEFYEEVEEGEMPLTSYTWAHSEAKLSNEQKELIINWAKTVRKKYQ